MTPAKMAARVLNRNMKLYPSQVPLCVHVLTGFVGVFVRKVCLFSFTDHKLVFNQIHNDINNFLWSKFHLKNERHEQNLILKKYFCLVIQMVFEGY